MRSAVELRSYQKAVIDFITVNVRKHGSAAVIKQYTDAQSKKGGRISEETMYR